MTETILSEILNFGHSCLPVGGGAYLKFGLPARSRFGEGRRLVFGASPDMRSFCYQCDNDITPESLIGRKADA